MKGIINIEFVLSVFVFLGTISFISIFIGQELILLQNNIMSDNLKSESYQISELLLFDPGTENWEIETDINNIKRFGFSNGTDYFLSKTKLDKFNQTCRTNYTFVNEKLSNSAINITVQNLDENISYLKCEPPVKTLRRPKFITERIGILENEIVKMTITLIE